MVFGIKGLVCYLIDLIGQISCRIPHTGFRHALPGVLFLPVLQLVILSGLHHRTGPGFCQCLVVLDCPLQNLGNLAVRLRILVGIAQFFHKPCEEILDFLPQTLVLILKLPGDPANGIRVCQHHLRHFRNGLIVGNVVEFRFALPLVLLHVRHPVIFSGKHRIIQEALFQQKHKLPAGIRQYTTKSQIHSPRDPKLTQASKSHTSKCTKSQHSPYSKKIPGDVIAPRYGSDGLALLRQSQVGCNTPP